MKEIKKELVIYYQEVAASYACIALKLIETDAVALTDGFRLVTLDMQRLSAMYYMIARWEMGLEQY
jgi:hypothetical protein